MRVNAVSIAFHWYNYPTALVEYLTCSSLDLLFTHIWCPKPTNLVSHVVPSPALQVWPCPLRTTTWRRMTNAPSSAPWHLTMESCRVPMCRRGAKEDAHAAWTGRTHSTDKLWAWVLSRWPTGVVLGKRWVCASTGTSTTPDATQEVRTPTKGPSTLITSSTPGSSFFRYVPFELGLVGLGCWSFNTMNLKNKSFLDGF